MRFIKLSEISFDDASYPHVVWCIFHLALKVRSHKNPEIVVYSYKPSFDLISYKFLSMISDFHIPIE